MKLKSLIDSEGQYVTLQVESDDGEVKKKVISFRTYVEYINSIATENNGIRLGRMPRGFFDGSIVDNKNYKVVVVIPKQRTPLFYSDTHFEVPYPDLAFFYQVEKGKVTYSKVFALKTVTEESMLYHYPYTNVYDDGRICWGCNHLPECNSLADVDMLTSLFFSAKCNDDLFTPRKMLRNCDMYTGNVRAYLQKVSENDAFPEEFLLETGKTLGDLLS